MLRALVFVAGGIVAVATGSDLYSRLLASANIGVQIALCEHIYVCQEGTLRDSALKMLGDRKTIPQATGMLKSAVGRSPGAAYRWADLGDAYVIAGDVPSSRKCYDQALALSPGIPAMQWRISMAYVRAGDLSASLSQIARILSEVAQFDSLAFGFLDQLRLPTKDLLGKAIPPNRRAAQAYFEHLLQKGDPAGSQAVYAWLTSQHLLDENIARRYANLLLKQRDFAHASQAWRPYAQQAGLDRPKTNLIYNPGFDLPASYTDLDWNTDPVPEVEVARDSSIHHGGDWSMRIRFTGSGNVRFQSVHQTVLVPPGAYRLSAWVRSEGLTTDEGVRLRIADAELPARLLKTSAPVLGTQPWKQVQVALEVPVQTRALDIRVVRDASKKFDSRIAGTVWIDDFTLTRDEGAAWEAATLRQAPGSTRMPARSGERKE